MLFSQSRPLNASRTSDMAAEDIHSKVKLLATKHLLLCICGMNGPVFPSAAGKNIFMWRDPAFLLPESSRHASPAAVI